MKRFVFIGIFVAFAACLHAQGIGDSLVVNLKNGQRIAIPISSIQKITFDTVLSDRVQYSGNATAGLNVKDNYPNPFHSQTNIVFSVSEPGIASINVFDLKGEFIKSIEKIDCTAGQNTVPWDGKDQKGDPVPIGTYLYELHFGSHVQTRKAVVVQ